MGRKMRYGLHLVTLLSVWTSVSWGQGMPVPLQYQLFVKILHFDRGLTARVGDELTLGIVYQSLYKRSQNTKHALVGAMEASRPNAIKGVPIVAALIDLAQDGSLRNAVVEQAIDALYVAPVRAYDLDFLTQVCREHGITTWTGVPEYCQNGVSVGFDARGGKARDPHQSHGCQGRGHGVQRQTAPLGQDHRVRAPGPEKR